MRKKISLREKSRLSDRALNPGAPMYTASAPSSMAASNAGKLPAGANSSGGEESLIEANATKRVYRKKHGVVSIVLLLITIK